MLEFVEPATPVSRSIPPRGPDWLHEAKFDGWRIQLHKDGGLVRLYTKNGYDCTRHFGGLTRRLSSSAAVRKCRAWKSSRPRGSKAVTSPLAPLRLSQRDLGLRLAVS
jgi:ATP dependent DNA ligase domain